MPSPTYYLLDQFRRTFNGDAWHGPNLMDTLHSIPPHHAERRLNASHSIGELAGHILAWRLYTIAKMEGDDTYAVSDAANFPVITADTWAETLTQLDASQRRLLQLLESLPEDELEATTPGKSHTQAVLLHGLIHHDMYHLGQLVLMKQYL